MRFEKQLITPGIAKKYLETNTHNRRLKMPIILRYAQDMIASRWKENTGEVIKISKSGTLLDGQHRLMAVIKSNKPISFHVAFDVDESVFDVIDTGSNRNASDAFKIEGIKHENVIPSIINTYYLLKNNYIGKGQKNSRLTNAMLLESYYEDETFWQNIALKTMVWYNAFAKILAPSIIGGMFALFFKIDNEDAETFMLQLATGQKLTSKSIGQLRQKLIKDKMSPRKMTIALKYALILRTWNYFRRREELNLKFDTVRDIFPVPV